MWSKKQIKNRTKEYKSIAGKTQTQYLKFIKSKGERFPSPTTIRRYFGSWNDFKIEVYGAKAKLHRKNIGLNSIREIIQEEVEKQLEGLELSGRVWPKIECRKKLLSFPEIENMTITKYIKWRKDKDLPSKNIVCSRFNGWKGMQNELFGKNFETKPKFCKVCLYKDKCEYNYNLKKCKWYEEG